MLTLVSIGGSSYATAQENVEASGHHENENDVLTPRTGYWPRGDEAELAHGSRPQVEWGEQHPKVLCRKEPHAAVEEALSHVPDVPNEEEMQEAPQV